MRSSAAKPKRKRNPETDLQSVCLRLARAHAAVAWCQRLNSFAGHLWSESAPDHKGHFVRAGWEGASDLIGQLRGPPEFGQFPSGRLLLVECKGPDTPLADEQRKFLIHAGENGAIAFVARDPLDVLGVLNAYWDLKVHSGYLFDLRPYRAGLSASTAEALLTTDAQRA